jgi:ABC-type dipeptide/oligopeptide/nickel transport system permease component
VTLGVSVLTFSLLHLLPGDPVLVMLGDAGHPPERIAELRTERGLEDPVAVQYVRYLGNLLRGDLGRSIRSNRPVLDELRQQAPNTLASPSQRWAWPSSSAFSLARSPPTGEAAGSIGRA